MLETETMKKETFALQGCYSALTGYQYFRITYHSLPLQMGPIACPETSVTNYQSVLHKIPE